MHICNNVLKAYAKINLHLEVLNKRSDNYHNIFSLMANVDLYDLLKLDECNISDKSSGEITVDIELLPGKYSSLIESFPVNENIISRSVKFYLNRLGKSGYVKFSLEKNIPIGAGLAGGSGDGAAAVHLLSKEMSQTLDKETISSLSKIGADLPFCLTGGFQFSEGIGEILEPLNERLNYYILIINNGIAVNTAEAYGILNRDSSERSLDFSEKKKMFRDSISNNKIAIINNIFFNDFEKPVFSIHKELKVLKEKTVELGADFTLMSGSGSTVFALFTDLHQAKKAEDEMKKQYELVILTKFI